MAVHSIARTIHNLETFPEMGGYIAYLPSKNEQYPYHTFAHPVEWRMELERQTVMARLLPFRDHLLSHSPTKFNIIYGETLFSFFWWRFGGAPQKDFSAFREV